MTHNGKIQLLDVVGDWRIGTWNVRGLAFGLLDDSLSNVETELRLVTVW